MIVEERLNKIVEIVSDEGRITIAEICDLFDISDMTARRDLNKLDRQGLLRRVHGGAIAQLGRSYEPPFPTRSKKNIDKKKAIGERAADLIYDGDSIALDVGTTTLEIVHGLRQKRNLTIVTSCLQIVNEIAATLSLEQDVRLIMVGGIVRPRELSLVGMFSERMYQDLHVDKAFIGIGGISLKDGLTEYNLEDARIKQILLQSAREKIVVADSSKFGKTTFVAVGPLSAVDWIVTDVNVPNEMIEQINSLGVKVIIADQQII